MRASSSASAVVALLSLALAAAACGSTKDKGFDDTTPVAPQAGPGGSDLGSSGATPKEPTGIGFLAGTVLAPEGTVPISNALVYLAPSMPAHLAPGLV